MNDEMSADEMATDETTADETTDETISFRVKPVDATPAGTIDRTTAEYVELYSIVDSTLKRHCVDKFGSYDMLDNVFHFMIWEIVKNNPRLKEYAYSEQEDGNENARCLLFDWCDNNCPGCGANIARGIFPADYVTSSSEET
jgi:hypothetical protein